MATRQARTSASIPIRQTRPSHHGSDSSWPCLVNLDLLPWLPPSVIPRFPDSGQSRKEGGSGVVVNRRSVCAGVSAG